MPSKFVLSEEEHGEESVGILFEGNKITFYGNERLQRRNKI